MARPVGFEPTTTSLEVLRLYDEYLSSLLHVTQSTSIYCMGLCLNASIINKKKALTPKSKGIVLVYCQTQLTHK